LLDLVQIGKKLTDERLKKQMTQEELAETLYVSHQAVSKWERGISLPSVDNLVFLTDLYRIPLEELLCMEAPSLDKNLDRLFEEHDRSFVIHESTLGRLKGIKLEDIIHKLSEKERKYALYLLIENERRVDEDLWPRLSLDERQMLIHRYQEGRVKLHLEDLGCLMTPHEKRRMKEKKH